MRGSPPRFVARSAGLLGHLAIACAWCLGSTAWAHESGGALLPKDVPAVTDEGARAKAMVAEVQAASKEVPSDVAASLARTRQALARANGAHATGDARTSRLLGKVALGWAEAAKAQLAATRSERASGEVERAALDLAARRDRGRALVTESQARRGQLTSQIERKKKDIEAAKAPPPAKQDAKGDSKKSAPVKPAPRKGAKP